MQHVTCTPRAGVRRTRSTQQETPTIPAARARKQAAKAIFGTWQLTPEPLCTIKHSITRYRITIEVFRVTGKFLLTLSSAKGRWLNLKKLQELPFASAHRKILLLVRQPVSSARPSHNPRLSNFVAD